jgi:small-conductance mechanosensitive channel
MPEHSTRFLSASLFSPTFWLGFTRSSLDTLWEVVKIVVVYVVLRTVLRRLVDRVVVPVITHSERVTDAEQAARIKTLAGLLNNALGYVLVFVFGVMVLRAFHLDPVPLLTTASVAGLAVGFGAQKLVKDVISGFFILLENQYAVGDYVTIGAVTGTIQEVGMRITRIRDDAGRLYIIANGDISQVCNNSRGPTSTFIEIAVPSDVDVARVTEIIDGAGKALAIDRKDLGFAEPPTVQGIGAGDAAKTVLRVTTRTTAPAKLADAQLALRGAILHGLRDADIRIA